jgi:hypothetical protein
MTAAVGDCNGDLLPDILVSRLGYGSLYMATPEHIYLDRMMASGLATATARYVGWGCNFLDMDNDGDLDAFIANGDAHRLGGLESLLLENQGNGNFVDAAEKGGAYFRTAVRARGSAVLDYDNDGRLDLVVTAMGDRCFLLHNRCPAPNRWLKIKLQGVKCNRDGFGAKVTVKAGGRTQRMEARCQAGFLSTSDPRLHFGLGNSAKADEVEVRWPDGHTQTLHDVAADQVLAIKES